MPGRCRLIDGLSPDCRRRNVSNHQVDGVFKQVWRENCVGFPDGQALPSDRGVTLYSERIVRRPNPRGVVLHRAYGTFKVCSWRAVRCHPSSEQLRLQKQRQTAGQVGMTRKLQVPVFWKTKKTPKRQTARAHSSRAAPDVLRGSPNHHPLAAAHLDRWYL